MTAIAQTPQPVGASVLVEGKLLSGTELLDYAKQKGLCPKCVQHTTHKRIKKRLSVLRSEAAWVPITVKDKEAGNYVVYKGYCLQPTCWTLAEAKSLLGETPTIRRSKSVSRVRAVTPGRERPSLASTDDCSSCEITLNCSMSTASVQLDQPTRHIGTATSSRTVAPGQTVSSHHRPINRSMSARQPTNLVLKESDYGYETSPSRTCDNKSDHSRDITPIGRQTSSSSILSDISDISSNRHRISKIQLDVKVQENPPVIRPAMFYRRPSNHSESSGNDSDETIEDMIKASSSLKDSASVEAPARPMSRSRASIRNLIQATPRLLTNLLTDNQSIASSTRDLRNSENSTDMSLGQMNKVKISSSDDGSTNSRRSRPQFGKGKSSSNIQHQEKMGTMLRRSSISHVPQMQDGEESPYGRSPSRQNNLKKLLSPYLVVGTPQRSIKVCSSPRIETVSTHHAVAGSPASTHNRCSSFNRENDDMNHQDTVRVSTQRRASISNLPQPSINVLDNETSPGAVSLNRDRESRYQRAGLLHDFTREGYRRNHQENTHTANRRRASISYISQTPANVLDNDMSPRGLPPTPDRISRRPSVGMLHENSMNRREQSITTNRRRASISYISQLPVSIESSPGGMSLTRSRVSRHQSVGMLHDSVTETYSGNTNHNKESDTTNRRRASISYVSQIPDNIESSPGGMSLSRSRESRRASVGMLQDRNHHERSDTPKRSSISYISQVPVNIESSPGGMSLTHDVRQKRLSDSSVSVTSLNMVYRRYSLSEASYSSDNDDDAVDSFLKSVESSRHNTATEMTKVSNLQSSAQLTRPVNFVDSQGQSQSDDWSDSIRSSENFDYNSDSSSVRQRTPEIVILGHICNQSLENGASSDVQKSAIVPTEFLWAKLQKRYGDLINSASAIDKILTLVNVLDQTQDTECYEKCWELLSYLTKQGIGDDDICSGAKVRILRTMDKEFDRKNFDYNAKLHAAVTMSHIIAEEKMSTGKTATLWFNTMTRALRLNWISVLSDVLHFRDYKHIEQRKGTVQVVDSICYLLVAEILDDQDSTHTAERNRLFSNLIDVSFSILNAVAFENGESAMDTSCLCCAIFSMLISVISHSLVEERHVRCLSIVYEVMEKLTSDSTLCQGLLITKQILSKFKFPDESEVREFDETIYQAIATTVNEMVQKSLMFEQMNQSPKLILESISLVALLIEINDHMERIVTNLDLLQRPIIVEAIIRLIDTGNNSSTNHVDEGFFILLCLITKHPLSGSHLLQVQSIGCRLVMWLTRYCNASVQEFVCLILEYLVASDGQALGKEIGNIGGLVVLSELFHKSAQSCCSNLNQAVSRALVGVLVAVDSRSLHEYNTIVRKFIVDSMSSNATCVDLQLAGLSIIHCVCRRCDSVASIGSVVLPVVTASMNNHLENVVLLTMSCVIIRLISQKLEDWSVIVESDAFGSVVNTLLVHPTSTELVLEGMATIKDLARKESFRAFFNPEDAEIAIASILPLHSDKPDVVALSFGSLNNIAINTSTSTVAPMQLDVLHFIISALNTFRHDRLVTRNACLLLKSYTYNPDNLNVMRSCSESVITTLTLLTSSQHIETRDRARYIIKKVQRNAIQPQFDTENVTL